MFAVLDCSCVIKGKHYSFLSSSADHVNIKLYKFQKGDCLGRHLSFIIVFLTGMNALIGLFLKQIVPTHTTYVRVSYIILCLINSIVNQ